MAGLSESPLTITEWAEHGGCLLSAKVPQKKKKIEMNIFAETSTNALQFASDKCALEYVTKS